MAGNGRSTDVDVTAYKNEDVDIEMNDESLGGISINTSSKIQLINEKDKSSGDTNCISKSSGVETPQTQSANNQCRTTFLGNSFYSEPSSPVSRYSGGSTLSRSGGNTQPRPYRERADADGRRFTPVVLFKEVDRPVEPDVSSGQPDVNSAVPSDVLDNEDLEVAAITEGMQHHSIEKPRDGHSFIPDSKLSQDDENENEYSEDGPLELNLSTIEEINDGKLCEFT